MFLGIDLGTSEIKAVLVDESGALAGAAGCPLGISRPRPRWSEQVPDDWWEATLNAVDALQIKAPRALAAVRGIGLSGQMHGAVLLGQQDDPLRPAILWNDTRSDAECVELMRKVPDLPALAGNLAMPGFTAPKLLWVKRHEPEIFARTRAVLLPKDYLRLKLTGEKASDPSDASGTLWLDVAARRWSETLLNATDLTLAHMPTLVNGNATSGQLRRTWAERWGIQHPVSVAGGAGDNAASAVGLSAVSAGDGFISLGTSGVVFVVDQGFHPNPHSAVHAYCHTLPGLWHRMSVMLSAASCLSWVTALLGVKEESSLVDEIAQSADDPAQLPIFLPYLSGERTPHNDPFAQGAFVGLSHDTNRVALGRAVLEGVAFGLADGLDALNTTGTSPASYALVGGGARSPYWAQLLADVLGLNILTHRGNEAAAAVGAARLAQLACGASVTDVCRKPDLVASYSPRPEVQSALQVRRQKFRHLYPSLKSFFHCQTTPSQRG